LFKGEYNSDFHGSLRASKRAELLTERPGSGLPFSIDSCD
jgi:hypothetical protein